MREITLRRMCQCQCVAITCYLSHGQQGDRHCRRWAKLLFVTARGSAKPKSARPKPARPKPERRSSLQCGRQLPSGSCRSSRDCHEPAINQPASASVFPGACKALQIRRAHPELPLFALPSTWVASGIRLPRFGREPACHIRLGLTNKTHFRGRSGESNRNAAMP